MILIVVDFNLHGSNRPPHVKIPGYGPTYPLKIGSCSNKNLIMWLCSCLWSTGVLIGLMHSSRIRTNAPCSHGCGCTYVRGWTFFFFFFLGFWFSTKLAENKLQISLIRAKIIVKKNVKIIHQNTLFWETKNAYLFTYLWDCTHGGCNPNAQQPMWCDVLFILCSAFLLFVSVFVIVY